MPCSPLHSALQGLFSILLWCLLSFATGHRFPLSFFYPWSLRPSWICSRSWMLLRGLCSERVPGISFITAAARTAYLWAACVTSVAASWLLSHCSPSAAPSDQTPRGRKADMCLKGSMEMSTGSMAEVLAGARACTAPAAGQHHHLCPALACRCLDPSIPV